MGIAAKIRQVIIKFKTDISKQWQIIKFIKVRKSSKAIYQSVGIFIGRPAIRVVDLFD